MKCTVLTCKNSCSATHNNEINQGLDRTQVHLLGSVFFVKRVIELKCRVVWNNKVIIIMIVMIVNIVIMMKFLYTFMHYTYTRTHFITATLSSIPLFLYAFIKLNLLPVQLSTRSHTHDYTYPRSYTRTYTRTHARTYLDISIYHLLLACSREQ